MVVALGPNKCHGLPFFHAFTGCDTWETWKSCDEVKDVIAAFHALAATLTPSAIDDHMDALECLVFVLSDRTSSQEHVNECCKHLFTQNGRSIDAVPPTREALNQHTKRSATQSRLLLVPYDAGHPKSHHRQVTGVGLTTIRAGTYTGQPSQRQLRHVGNY